MAPVGQPHESPRPEPIGNMPTITLFTICTLCGLYILWRRAESLRRVVSHQLKEMTRTSGRIRLSEDGGPPSAEFLEDDYDDDNETLSYDPHPTGLSSINIPNEPPRSLSAGEG